MIDYLGGGRSDTSGQSVDYVVRDRRDHAGGSTANDPRVGMIGGSYGGEVQFAAAKVDPRLDTIVPLITWNDLAYSLAPNNTSFLRGVTYDPAAPGVTKYQWTSLFFAVGISGASNGDQTRQGPCPNFNDQVCPIKAQMDALGYADAAGIAFARSASVTSYTSAIKIPTYLGQGQNDTLFNLNEAVATYNALRAQGTPVKMLWKADGHSASPLGQREASQSNPEAAYASRSYLEWFDYYLRGVGDPPRLDFSYYRDWADGKTGDAAAAVASTAAYPAAAAQRWLLSGDGTLAPAGSPVTAGTRSWTFAAQAATSHSEGSGPLPDRDPSDQPGTFAAWTSRPLAAATDVVGIPQLTVTLDAQPQSATQADPSGRLVLFAKLYEVKADGSKVLPARLIAPVRVPDLSKPVTIALPGIVHRFAAGSQLQVVLAASDEAYRNNSLAGTASVTVDSKAPPVFTLPVIASPGASGAIPAPPVAAPPGSQSPGAGQQSQVAQEAQGTKAASLPISAQRCRRNRRVVTVRIVGVRRPDRIVSKAVTLNGRRVRIRSRITRVRRGGRTVRVRTWYARVDLRRKRAGSYRVFVLVRSKKGKVRRSARTYRVC